MGVKEYWGSKLACGIISMEVEDDADVVRRADEFYAFSSSLGRYTGHLGARMGAFGLLLIVAEGPTSGRFQKVVAGEKRGSAWRKDYCVLRLVDRTLREVFRHRGFPLTMPPGRAFFKRMFVQDGSAP